MKLPLPKRVHADLRNRMFDGTLPPGTRLDYKQLAKDLGVSTTPVREAAAKVPYPMTPATATLTNRRPEASLVWCGWLNLALLMTSTTDAGERALTTAPHGHQIHHCQAFSPDGRFIYYDYRNEETKLAGSACIGRVEVATGREELLYRTSGSGPDGPGVGAVTCDPAGGRLAFIHGLANASAAEPYAPHRRCGMSLTPAGVAVHLDARDLGPPVTPGALRGGTHAFHWSPDGRRISFTYNDATVPPRPAPDDLRTVGVMEPGRPVAVAAAGAGEFGGGAFATVVVPVKADPRPGSDEMRRAFDEGWLGPARLAFQGMIRTLDGRDLTEVFVVTLPVELEGPKFPAAGVPVPRPGIEIRRLTHTEGRPYPGVQGPRHWVRPAPDGSWVAFLAKDDLGVVPVFKVAPEGGEIRQLSRLETSVETPFDWSPDGRSLACAAGGRIWLIEAGTGTARALTEPAPPGQGPRYSVCFSPTGRMVAYNRPLPAADGTQWLQVMVCEVR